MTRSTVSVARRARHKKVLKMAKGFRGRSSTCFRIALEKVEKALQYQYRDRKNRKRDMRALWIQRINAAARSYGLSYSKLMGLLHAKGIELDRKLLSEIAIKDATAFGEIVKSATAGSSVVSGAL